MKKLLLTLFLLNFLYSCQSVQEGFKLKENNSDEFLVEKKNPLVLPPDFEKLPVPKSSDIISEENEEENFEQVLNSKSASENPKDIDSKSKSTEEFILKNIKKNESD